MSTSTNDLDALTSTNDLKLVVPPESASSLPSPYDAEISTIISTTHVDGEAGGLELMHMYKGFDTATRHLFWRMGRSLINNVSFRHQMDEFTPPSQPFRLMDLPIELRVHIAEYALTSEEPLYWYWTYFGSGEEVGRFNGLMRLTALCRVSKQLHAELWPVVWKVNTFSFEEDNFGMSYLRHIIHSQVPHGPFGPRIVNVSDAYDFFLRKTPDQRLGFYHSISIVISWSGDSFDRQDFFYYLEAFTHESLTAHVKLQPDNWISPTPSATSVSAFMHLGRKIEAEVSDRVNYTDKPRYWRVFPSSTENVHVRLQDFLSEAELQQVQDWSTKGI